MADPIPPGMVLVAANTDGVKLTLDDGRVVEAFPSACGEFTAFKLRDIAGGETFLAFKPATLAAMWVLQQKLEEK